MSLKDQLLKAGLVSKKQARKSDQKKRKQRKKAQGSREARAVLDARKAKADKEQRAREKRERLEAKRARERAREQQEMVRRVDQILNAHRVSFQHGRQPFWYPSPDKRFLFRLNLPESVAYELHGGKLGIAYRKSATTDEPDVVLIPRETVERIQRLAPQRILFHNAERPKDPEDMMWSADEPRESIPDPGNRHH